MTSQSALTLGRTIVPPSIIRVLRQYIRGRSSRRPLVPPVVSSLPCQLSREGYGGVVGLGGQS